MSANPSGRVPQVAVIGSGIIGLSIAWVLAQRGASVTVYDANERAAASPASGGMLSAIAESGPGDREFERLCRHSLNLWQGFASDLERATGRSIGLDMTGNLLVATSDEEARALEILSWASEGDLRPAEHAAEPALSPDIKAAFIAEGDGVVDPRRALAALAHALDLCHVRRILARVDGIQLAAGRAQGVRIGEDRDRADAVVLAAGVWSARVLGASGLAGLVPPLGPVKGQMLSLDARCGPRLRRVVRSAHHYLIPRADQLVVGATSEPGQFDDTVTPEAVAALREGAQALVPALGGCDIVEAWAGLRPSFPDGLPIFGQSSVSGLFLALGHYRNGVLLAPLTADRVAAEVLEGGPPRTPGARPPKAQPPVA